MKKSKDSAENLGATSRQTNICIIRAPEGKEKGAGSSFKVMMAEIAPNSEAQRAPKKMNLKRFALRHILTVKN